MIICFTFCNKWFTMLLNGWMIERGEKNGEVHRVKKWLVLMIYAADVFFCLRAVKNKDSHEYALTKPFLMPLLCGVYFRRR